MAAMTSSAVSVLQLDEGVLELQAGRAGDALGLGELVGAEEPLLEENVREVASCLWP